MPTRTSAAKQDRKAALGRPTKLTPATKRKLLEGIGRGYILEVAAARAGIDYRTLANWVERGQAEEGGEFHDFFQELTHARFKGEAELADTIHEASQSQVDGDWHAAAHILACRHPERWSKREKVDAEVKHSGGITLVFRDVPADATKE
jgi:transposase